MTAIPEPPEGTIVAWWDPNGDLFAVFHRTDAYDLDEDETNHWFYVQWGAASNEEALTWPELLEEMAGFRGPIELVSKGEIARGGE